MQQIITEKKRFAAAIKVFIKHKKTLSEKSDSSFYRNSLFLRSLSQCNGLVLMAERNCNEYSFSKLCIQLLVHQEHLKNILPASNNKSYKSQVETLENLILTANTYK